jgi:hypothetical protein
MELKHGGEWKKRKEKRKEKTMPFGVSFMRSQVLYRAAQDVGTSICGEFDHLQSMARACSQQDSMACIAVHMVGTFLHDQGIDAILASFKSRLNCKESWGYCSSKR